MSVLRRIEWCIQLPESDEGYHIACELIALSHGTFNGDEKLMEKVWEVRKRPASETGLDPVSDAFTISCLCLEVLWLSASRWPLFAVLS